MQNGEDAVAPEESNPTWQSIPVPPTEPAPGSSRPGSRQAVMSEASRPGSRQAVVDGNRPGSRPGSLPVTPPPPAPVPETEEELNALDSLIEVGVSVTFIVLRRTTWRGTAIRYYFSMYLLPILCS